MFLKLYNEIGMDDLIRHTRKVLHMQLSLQDLTQSLLKIYILRQVIIANGAWVLHIMLAMA